MQNRKLDHLKIATTDVSQIGSTGFDDFRFLHNALPEIDFDQINLSSSFLGKKVNYPFLISCMTGGAKEGKNINRVLATAAQKFGIAMGVGSQRIAVEKHELEGLFKAREMAPDIPLLANIGIVQLNYGYELKEYQKCIDMIGADALVVHINPIQEIIQPEGDRNWSELLPKLEKIVKKLTVPVIAKEVGFGLSGDVVKRLYNIGVRIFDTAGWGGTNWAMVEGLRGKADLSLGKLFSQWGIPTAESITLIDEVRSKFLEKITVIGSGGIRNGVDIAKALVLGSDLVAIASPFAKAAMISAQEVDKLIKSYVMELETAMFGVGAISIKDLKKAKLVKQYQ